MKSQLLLQPLILLLSLPSALSATLPRSVEKPLGVGSAKEQNYIIALKTTEKRPWAEIVKSFGQPSQPENVITKTVRIYGLKLTAADALKISKLPFVAGVALDSEIHVPGDKLSELDLDADEAPSEEEEAANHARDLIPSPAIVARANALKVRKDATWAMQRISSGVKVEKNPKGKNTKYTYSYDPKTDTGAGVDVYVVDGGIDMKNSQFGGRAKQIYSFSRTRPQDVKGHGTHVAGIIGSKSFGIAKNVNLISIKVTGASDQWPSLSEILAGYDTAIENHMNRKKDPKFVASIINMSNGGGAGLEPLKALLAKAESEGMHMVAAAGNERRDACFGYPAGFNQEVKSLITVGNIDINDELEVSSNFGKCVDIFAPGTDIISVALPKAPGSKKGMIAMTGTSMSTPMVAGVIAGQVLKHPELRNDPLAMKKHILGMAKSGIHNYNPSKGPDRILFRSN
ncbi:hypothetical protein H072_3049 [Dactylellina haptotyla CBS 200.50]|uniref:Peptidase S8/S53 domain-containing protein n=1 Tax=Dactylellina haptotyla (strain CBS 200.50) TaxID=1284197 RepID=S8AIW9_DACHA|nr:hypothetical protein H072_3049 [Dactylellina haptotyla CBS 200.50]